MQQSCCSLNDKVNGRRSTATSTEGGDPASLAASLSSTRAGSVADTCNTRQGALHYHLVRGTALQSCTVPSDPQLSQSQGYQQSWRAQKGWALQNGCWLWQWLLLHIQA
jgi:hypothetical protein